MLALDPAAREEFGAELASAVGSAYTIPLLLMALSVAVAVTGLARSSRARSGRGQPVTAAPAGGSRRER
jgi:hypothetical protein